MPFEFLDNEHDVFKAWKPIWARAERLLRGGVYVKNELRRFDWETAPVDANGIVQDVPISMQRDDGADVLVRSASRLPFARPGEHYQMRQRQAVYMNFPDLFGTLTVGQIMSHAPAPDFGTMGPVDRKEGQAEPSKAELVWYNTDGVGNDGSQWNSYWTTSAKRAMATGHRWHLAEASELPPRTFRDVKRGLRPYLVEMSPLKVPDWEYENGVLQYAIVRVPSTRPRRGSDGKIARPTKPGYLLMVRPGFGLFDLDATTDTGTFSAGGWWKFDDEKNLIAKGQWTKTGGEIPLFPLYYERDEGAEGTDDEEPLPAMSRPAIMEIGNAAVAYFNLTSAANFELWDGAKGIEWLRGVDNDAWELAMTKIAEGARYVPLQVNIESQNPIVPEIARGTHDGAVTLAINQRLSQMRDEVKELMSLELTGTPDASGVAKQAGFAEKKQPRLALIASEIEQAQNTAIHFLEMRFGATLPTGAVQWPRDFDPVNVGDEVDAFLNSQKVAGVTSPTLTARALVTTAIEKGIAKESERAEFEAEYKDAAKAASAATNNANALLGRFGVADNSPGSGAGTGNGTGAGGTGTGTGTGTGSGTESGDKNAGKNGAQPPVAAAA
jgi:hypothetical protein